MIVVRNRETGTIIEQVDSFEEGEELVEKFESEDRADNIYEENFYEVAEIEEQKERIDIYEH